MRKPIAIEPFATRPLEACAIFIVFDALAVFLFPWALVLRSFGLWALATMGLFLGILSLGWVYAYREGILEWK